MPLLDVTRQDGAVILTLNDPARRNLLSGALCAALAEQVALAEADPGARAIVIRANGKSFCAGADLEDLKAAAAGDTTAVRQVYNAFMTVANASLPTVAVIEGAAVGAGMNLALACDVRIASERASFDTRFLQIGLHPGGGHAWMLLRAVGWQNASRMLLLGDTLSGSEAELCGLVASCHQANAVDDGLRALLAKVNRTSRELLLRTKRTMRLAATQNHAQAFAHETEEQLWSLGQPAFAELVAQLQQTLATR
ncbi:MAG: enoyl-CoA hydratase-related protein [Pseudomonadota bacterium]